MERASVRLCEDRMEALFLGATWMVTRDGVGGGE